LVLQVFRHHNSKLYVLADRFIFLVVRER
jgi:hypothetical protein